MCKCRWKEWFDVKFRVTDRLWWILLILCLTDFLTQLHLSRFSIGNRLRRTSPVVTIFDVEWCLYSFFSSRSLSFSCRCRCFSSPLPFSLSSHIPLTLPSTSSGITTKGKKWEREREREQRGEEVELISTMTRVKLICVVQLVFKKANLRTELVESLVNIDHHQ